MLRDDQRTDIAKSLVEYANAVVDTIKITSDKVKRTETLTELTVLTGSTIEEIVLGKRPDSTDSKPHASGKFAPHKRFSDN